MFEYILVIYLGNAPHYVGTFPNCQQAEHYVRHAYPTFDSICQHRNYIYLPKKLKEKFMYEFPNNKIVSIEQTTDYPCLEHKGCDNE